MLPSNTACDVCRVASTCLPFRLGLTESENGKVPHTVISRGAGELVLEKAEKSDLVVVRVGWAARYVLFPDGRRQITDIVLPGDFIGCSELVATYEALPLVALSEVQACVFERSSLLSALTACPQRMLELMKVCGGQAIRLRYLLAAMGRQSGAPRIAAFLLGLHRRLKALGDASDREMPYHLRQQDLADILGMTQVHVSRTMRSFYEGKILNVSGKVAYILNPDHLERLARC